MKFFKSLIAVICIAALSVPTFADDKAQVLDGLKIMQQEASDNEITREELACIAVRMLGVEKSPSQTEFTDVAQDHWASGYIQAAKDLGLVSGYGDGTFGLGHPVTGHQAVKVLVCLLGYSQMAQQKGGYPTGYMAAAAAIGMLKGTEAVTSAPISHKDMQSLVYNSLHIPLMLVDVLGTDGKMSTEKDVTVLTYYLGLRKSTGVVEANAHTALYDKQTDKGKVVVAGAEYTCLSSQSLEDYIGFSVEFYFNDNHEIVYYVLREQNKVTELLGKDIIRADRNRIVYDEKEREKEIKISAGTPLLYNGRFFNDLTETNAADILKPNGIVKLIDNNGDGKQDAISVVDFKTCIVQKATEDTIYFKNGVPPISYQEDDVVFLDEEFDRIRPQDLKEWNIFNAMFDYASNQFVGALVANNWVRGEIQSISTDKIYVFDGWYPVEKSLLAQLKVGMEDTFYINYDGIIVARKNQMQTDGFEKAYLLKCNFSEKLFQNSLSLEMLLPDNTRKVFDVSENCKLNGQKTDAGQILQALDANRDNGGQAIENAAARPTQALKYKLDKEGKIDELLILQPISYTQGTKRYQANIHGFISGSDVKAYIAPQTFIVKSSLYVDKNGTPEYKYSALGAYPFLHQQYYNVNIYEVEEDGSRYATFMVVYEGFTGVGTDVLNSAIVTNISRALDENDEEQIEISFENFIGNSETILVAPDVYEQCGTLSVGDVFRRTVVEGEITQYARDFGIKEMQGGADFSTGALEGVYCRMQGVIRKLTPEFIWIGKQNVPVEAVNPYKTAGAKFILVDNEKQLVTNITQEEAESCVHENNPEAKAVAFIREGSLNAVVIYQ